MNIILSVKIIWILISRHFFTLPMPDIHFHPKLLNLTFFLNISIPKKLHFLGFCILKRFCIEPFLSQLWRCLIYLKKFEGIKVFSVYSHIFLMIYYILTTIRLIFSICSFLTYQVYKSRTEIYLPSVPKPKLSEFVSPFMLIWGRNSTDFSSHRCHLAPIQWRCQHEDELLNTFCSEWSIRKSYQVLRRTDIIYITIFTQFS